MSLNYVRLWISDYLGDTSSLSVSEHGAYLLLLLEYYRKGPLPDDIGRLNRICRATTQDDQSAVSNVADEFFPVNGDGRRHNKRADEEIAKATEAIRQMSEAGREGAARRWGKDGEPHAGNNGEPYGVPDRGEHRVVDAGGDADGDADGDATTQPLTHLSAQPLSPSPKAEARQRSPKGSRLPSDWQPSESLKAWAINKRPGLDLQEVVEKFTDHWISVPGAKGCKLNWDATFRNWVRRELPGQKRDVGGGDVNKIIRDIEEEDRRKRATH